ncbi:hypothetical protein QYQ99_27560 (plasmid) [Comamonas testosteroni]|nr:hypothetical protein [Comamonas testosteroni]WKL18762.1 hypothetical protein QYQ99_27560 [Comamonas testosteroni]
MKRSWMRVKTVATVALIAATVSAVHAAQVEGESCAHVSNGTFGGRFSKTLICANQVWQDAETLPQATISIAKYSASNAFVKSRALVSLVGTPVISKEFGVPDAFSIFATVVRFNADNTAHVVVDIETGDGWQKHIEKVVSTGTETRIAIDGSGAEYRMSVVRHQ